MAYRRVYTHQQTNNFWKIYYESRGIEQSAPAFPQKYSKQSRWYTIERSSERSRGTETVVREKKNNNTIDVLTVQGCNKSRLPLFRMIAKNERACVCRIDHSSIAWSESPSFRWETVSCTVGTNHQINSVGQMSRTKIEGETSVQLRLRHAMKRIIKIEHTARGTERGGGDEAPLTSCHFLSPLLPFSILNVWKAK